MLDMLSDTANILILSIPGVVLLEDVDFAAALECSSSQVVPVKKSAKKGSGVCDFDNFFSLFITVWESLTGTISVGCRQG